MNCDFFGSAPDSLYVSIHLLSRLRSACISVTFSPICSGAEERHNCVYIVSVAIDSARLNDAHERPYKWKTATVPARSPVVHHTWSTARLPYDQVSEFQLPMVSRRFSELFGKQLARQTSSVWRCGQIVRKSKSCMCRSKFRKRMVGFNSFLTAYIFLTFWALLTTTQNVQCSALSRESERISFINGTKEPYVPICIKNRKQSVALRSTYAMELSV